MGTLYGWDSTAVAYMDIVGKINYIITNLQQTNTLLNNTIDVEDALALQVFKQTAGQGSGQGGEFVITAFLEYLTYNGLQQRVVNDSPTYYPTNTTSSMLTYMQNTFLRETVYDFATNVP